MTKHNTRIIALNVLTVTWHLYKEYYGVVTDGCVKINIKLIYVHTRQNFC